MIVLLIIEMIDSEENVHDINNITSRLDGDK